jgi:uncharacterized 2Fe-2S/4Fe-4S cluster protein (DUF4445 family)
MISVNIIPGEQTGNFPEGTLLLDALLEMGIILKTPCGGKGICGKCRTRVEGALSDKTDAEIKTVGNETGIRLACQTKLAGNAGILIHENQFIDTKTYPAVNSKNRYAIAVDVGTTSVRLDLVDVSQGMEFHLDSFLNPQRRFGHDVISRIAAAKNPESRKTMTRMICRSIFTAIGSARKAMNLPVRRVEKIVFSGNTTMMHLLFGMDVSDLGRYPFTAEHLDFPDTVPGEDHNMLFPHARISAIPAVSAFLGGDFLGGLTLCYQKKLFENTFFIDLGTNGEMFLIHESGKIYAASCAMGPALEGMNISCGMTADEGAVTHVRLDSGKLAYTMIGQCLPMGLTGTALVDLTAIFLSERLILKNGAIASDLSQRQLPVPARFEEEKASKQIHLWNDISVSQKDIRSLQLAKAACLSSARLLLQKAGCKAEDVQHVLIAGALGSHLNLEHFRQLGFLPEFSRAIWQDLGNTSLQAAAAACIDDQFIRTAAGLRGKVTEVELARDPAFNHEFISALNF